MNSGELADFRACILTLGCGVVAVQNIPESEHELGYVAMREGLLEILLAIVELGLQ